MAGNSSSWHKVDSGPLVGEVVFVPPKVVGGLEHGAMQEQFAGGYGGWLNELPTGPLVTEMQQSPAFKEGQAVLKELPLVVQQVDGDHAVKKGTVQGPLAVVDTPFGHSIIHVTSGKALLYASDGALGKPKPTEASKALATQMMLTLNTLHDWSAESPSGLSQNGALLAASAESSKLGKFKVSHWVKGEGVKDKKQPAPNESSYQAALATLAVKQEADAEEALHALWANNAAQRRQSGEEEAWSISQVALMPNVVDEAGKVTKPVPMSPDGNFALEANTPHSWTLYHAPSGYPMAAGFISSAAAKSALAAVDEGIDWSHTSKEELFANKSNFAAVVAANKALQQAAIKSTQPAEMDAPAPAWEPAGGVANYPSLQAHEAALKQAYQNQMGFVRDTTLKQAQMKAVHAYQNGAFGAINAALWKGAVATAHATTQGQIKNLDYVMSLSSVPENMVVIRSQSSYHPLYAQMATLGVGDEYQTPAYDSASINLNNGWGGGAVKVNYRLPKGAKAFFMNALPHSPNAKGYKSIYEGEHECLIARNSRWKVVGKTVDGEGRIEVTVELVGQVKPKDL